MKNYKIKLTKLPDNKNNNLNAPQYSIKYNAANDIKAGYDILTRLKGDESLVLEINSSLILDPKINTQQYTEDFLNKVRNSGLDYKIRQTTVPSKSFLSQFFNSNKTTTETEIFVYITDTFWKDGFFEKIMPLNGARYYIVNNDTDGKEVLDRMDQMLETEKKQYFKLIVYHAAPLCQLGVSSSYLEEADLRGLLFN